MAQVVNLNRARKAKARLVAAVRADTNRAAFGRTKAAKNAARDAQIRVDRTLDGARRGS